MLVKWRALGKHTAVQSLQFRGHLENKMPASVRPRTSAGSFAERQPLELKLLGEQGLINRCLTAATKHPRLPTELHFQ